MGKIRKQYTQEKHGATLSTYVAEFIRTAESLPLHKLPSHLATFPSRWPFPRGDLYHWITLLNRFDGIFENFNKTYALDKGPQPKPFGRDVLLSNKPEPPTSATTTSEPEISEETLDNAGYSVEGDRELVESVINFTKLLHENCGNRSLYASSGRLSDILNTASLSLLEATLRLLHRLAQRYTAQRLRATQHSTHVLGHIRQDVLQSHYAVDLQKVESLAQPFRASAVEHSRDLFKVVDSDAGSALPLDLISKEGKDSTFSSFLPEGLPSYDHKDAVKNQDRCYAFARQIAALPAGATPSQDSYVAFNHLRNCQGILTGKAGAESNARIRLLAIANLAQIYPETTLQEKVLAYYAEKPRHQQLPHTLCDLIRPSSKDASRVPLAIQTLSLMALESLTNHKNLSTEVCTALNVSVNHGPLAVILRQAVTLTTASEGDELGSGEAEWLKEVFELVSALAKNHSRAVEGILSAGVIDKLLEILKCKSLIAEQSHEAALRCMGLYAWNVNEALGALVNAGGLDVMSDLLVHHIDRAVKMTKQGNGLALQYQTQATDYRIPFVQQQSLRSIFKFLNNMLGMAGGHFDRLMRNLLEASEVLTSLRTVIAHSNLFGSNVWSNCVRVFSTFINNEPTSYTAIAEAGIPRAILESITQRSLDQDDAQADTSNGETMQDVGAAPASSSGTSSSAATSKATGGILPACEAIGAVPEAFGAMCLNEAGAQQFQKSCAFDNLFGVFVSPMHVKALHSSVQRDIEALGGSIEQLHRHNPSLSTKIKELIISTSERVAHLMASAPPSGVISDDLPKDMNGLAHVTLSEDTNMANGTPATPTTQSSEPPSSSTSVSIYFTVFTKFLAQMFRNNTFCSHFAEHGGLDSLLTMAKAPGLFKDPQSTPHRFAEIIRHMVEQKPHIVIPVIVGELQSLVVASNSAETASPPVTEGSAAPAATDSTQIRDPLQNTVQIQLLAGSLAKGLSPTAAQNPSRHAPATPLVQVNVADLLCPLIQSLSRLQIETLRDQVVSRSTRSEQTTVLSNGQPSGTVTAGGGAAQSNGDHAMATSSTESSSSPTNRSNAQEADSGTYAAKCRVIMPGTIADLFAKISITIVPRKLSVDNYQRQQVFKVADSIAQALVDLLAFEFPDDTSLATILTFRKMSYECLKGCLQGHREFSQRNGPQLQTLVVRLFMNKGGIDRIGALTLNIMNLHLRVKSAESSDQQIRRRDDATSVMVKFVHLLGAICEKRAVMESPQTLVVQSRDRPDLFSTGQLLVELRLKVLKAIVPLWTSEDLLEMQSGVIRNISRVLHGIMEGTGEQGAHRRADTLPRPIQKTHKTWTPRNSRMASLTGEGYPQALAEEALYRCDDNEAPALEYCRYYSQRGEHSRHPPPAGDVQSAPPPPPPSPPPPPADESGHTDSPHPETDPEFSSDEDDEMTSEPAVNADDEDDPAAEALLDLAANRPPSALIDVLSDVANSILQDPSNAAHPSVPAPPDADQEPASDTEVLRAEEIPDKITSDDLDEERLKIRQDLMDCCLTLCGSYEDVTFELADLIVASTKKVADTQGELRSDISATLVMSLVSYVGNDNLQAEAKKLSGIAHLLGIVLQDAEFFEAAKDSLSENFSSLVDLLPIAKGQTPAEHAPWIPQILLILERVLVENVQPQHIHWTPPPIDDPLRKQPITAVPEKLTSEEDETNVFSTILDLLPHVGKELELGTALVRALIILTRARTLAKSLATKDNMSRFLSFLKQMAPVMTERFKASVMLVFRHIIEDHETIRRLITSDVKAMLERPPRPVDTTRFCKDLHHDVLRWPELFVEVVNDICEISRDARRPDASHHGPQIIILKKTVAPVTTEPETTSTNDQPGEDANKSEDVQPSAEKVNDDGKPKPVEMKPPVVEHPDGAIHALLCELLKFNEVEDVKPSKPTDASATSQNGDVVMTGQSTSSETSTVPASSTTSLDVKEHFKKDEHPIYLYRCFLLQTLTEMLASYNRTKVEFINFSRKADPQAPTTSKPRSGILNYLLNALLPTGSLEHAMDVGGKKKTQTSNYAVGTIVALCSRTTENGATKHRDNLAIEDEPELAFVRKFVLEHALKAYKDCMSSSDPVASKYSKLLALADLFNRMLAGRPASQSPYRRSSDDTLEASNKNIAKIMFEKNFTAALTTSMSDIDPKLPGSNRLIKYILRPLKLLTHTAIELSMAGDPSASPGSTTEEDEISSAASSVDDGGHVREETPDLYRNSALGMFEPGRQDSPSSSEDEGDGDEEMYGEEYGDGMDYEDGEEEPDEGDVVSDEDDQMDDVGPIEGLDGDTGIDVEIELDEEGSDDEEDEDEDEEMAEEAEDEEDEELELDEEGEEDDDDGEQYDEVTGDNENDSLGDELEEGEYDAEEEEELANIGHPTFGGLLGQPPDFPVDDEPSEAGLEPFRLPHLDAHLSHNHHLAMDLDVVDPVDLESGDNDDEEEEEYDEELMYQEAEDEDSEMPPYIFNPFPSTPGRRAQRAWPSDGIDSDDPMFDGSYRGVHGGPPQRGAEAADGQNPLLSRARRPPQLTGPRPGFPPMPGDLPPFASLLPRLEDLGPGSVGNPEQYQYLTNLISALGRGGAGGIMPTIRAAHGGHHHHHHHHPHTHTHDHGGISLRFGGPGGVRDDIMEIQIQHPHGLDLPSPYLEQLGLPAHMPPVPQDPAQAVNFRASQTVERWQEEARLIFGPLYMDIALKVVNSIHQALVPLAMDAENQRKKKEAEEQKKLEEQRQMLMKERAEQEEKERQEAEQKQREEAEAAAAAAAAQQSEETPEEPLEGAPDSMEGVETTIADQSAESAAEEPTPEAAAAGERVFTNIRGSQLDITDLGIDATYLEALPEEMREEVIMQQYAEHRSQAAAAGTEASTVDNEFLQALPDDIREEILAQERQDRRRRERQEQRRAQATASGQPAQAEEMDPASFMASLDPALRAQVLAEADDEMLNSLPPELAAEARALGGHHRRRAMDPSRLMADIDQLTRLGGRTRDRRAAIGGDLQRQRRPIVQMMDKASVNTLLRLMFLPIQYSARQTLNGILRNASGNHQSRAEIVSGLLQILQDGSMDHESIERSFSQMTNRAKQLIVQKTPIKRTQSSDTQASVVQTACDATPRLVIANCLASLMFLTQSIPHVPKFFLTEHELIGGSKSKGKAKGKARDTKASRIPLNALLGLLDRQIVIDDAQLIEHLAGLLQSVTLPLVQLLRKEKDSATTVPKPDDNQADGALAAATAEATTTSAEDPVPEQASASAPVETPAEQTATDAAAAEAPSENGTGDASASQPRPAETKPVVEPKKPFEAPEIPEENLRLIINILTAKDCGGKTFRDALSTINNLSVISGARQIFGQELVARARQLATSIMADLKQLTADFNKADDAMEAQNMALSKFSPTGSDQSKLNRILTALDYLFDAKNPQNKDKQNGAVPSGTQLLAALHDDPTFYKVWVELNHTFTAAHKILAQGQQSDKTFLNVATILLPLIESLMVVSKRLDLKDSRATASSQKMSAPNTPALESTMKQIFFKFTSDHRKILNDLVRQNPKLMSGSFAVLIKNSSVLEFDNKRNYFSRRLHHRSGDARHYAHPSLSVSVRRSDVFTDSYRSLFFKKPDEMKYGKLNVKFHNEEGVDAGGVTREWFAVLSRQMFNADFVLFNPVAADRTTFHPNPLSYINEQHLSYFQFIGRIIGKALYENRVLDCHFSRAVYKQLLGRQVSLKDMETIDLDYAKSAQWMLDNDITDIITETFSVTNDAFGAAEIIDLIVDGRNIPVTEENKHEYVRLVIEHKLTGSVKEQLTAFLKGFHDIVPAELVAIFDEGELELLISGLPEIDVFDWKSNTDYQNYNVNSSQIQWFWRAVRSFGKEERAKLLQFITGTGKVPLNGFKELEGMNGFTRFSIHKDFGDKDRLPSSHTCFNQLDLPEYDSYESLRKNLYIAMTTGGEYFGFA